MSVSPNQLQAWTCIKCGAALPAEAATGELVTCGYCGTPFSLPTAKTRCGGVTISGGSVTIGGDIIGGSKRVIFTGEVPSATLWDEPDSSDEDEGVSIDGDEIQVYGDVIGGSAVKIARSAVSVKSEPASPGQMALALDLAGDEQLATPERVAEPAPSVASEIPPAPKIGWREKVKRLFAN
jgi:hypothetical protein